MTGQPGIGKTWFLSFVLVDRLLRGEVTILQYGEDSDALLFDGTGVNYLSRVSSNRLYAVIRNIEVWALVDQTPRGFVKMFQDHEWLVLVTSSPKSENHKSLSKHHSAPIYYMQVWSWPEIVTAS